MEKKLSKLIGISKIEFDAYISCGQLKVRRANLIPTSKFGDEMALTSVLLSSMNLIKEFRNHILSDIKMPRSGKLYTYTEVEFPEFHDSRLDGLIIIVQGGIIKDAALLEMKNGSNVIDKGQIEKYSEIAKKFNIPRLVTVSNEFVSDPTQSPLGLRTGKGFDLYHLSWSYILTISHLLLFQNDQNISDDDQIEIMKEILHYFESDKSGVCGFNQMKAGWTKTIDSIHSGTILRATDEHLKEAVLSWQQEEMDLALLMSRKLGVLVRSGESKYKGKYQDRIDSDSKNLISEKSLESIFQVCGAVSDIKMKGLFEKKAIELSVSLKLPNEKITLRGQIGWLVRQLEVCSKKENEIFEKVRSEFVFEFLIKNTSKPLRVNMANMTNLVDELKGKELKECKIIQFKDFGKVFASRSKFVETIEEMMLDFYKCIVQNLKKWEPAAPKLNTIEANVSSSDEIVHVEQLPVQSSAMIEVREESLSSDDEESAA